MEPRLFFFILLIVVVHSGSWVSIPIPSSTISRHTLSMLNESTQQAISFHGIHVSTINATSIANIVSLAQATTLTEVDTNKPTSGHTATTFTVGANNAIKSLLQSDTATFVFGGQNELGTSTNIMIAFSLNVTSGFNALSFSNSITPPTPRLGHTQVYTYSFQNVSYTNITYSSSGYVIIFGGKQKILGDIVSYLNSMAVLALDDYTWHYLPPPTGNVPSFRSEHSAFLKEPYMYIFGGKDNSTCFDNLYRYDIVNNSWEIMYSTGNLPPGLYGHSSDVVGTNAYIFGGKTAQGELSNTMYEYNIDDNKWSIVCPISAPPRPRYLHASLVSSRGNGIYYHGGEASNVQFFNDWWLWNISMAGGYYCDISGSCANNIFECISSLNCNQDPKLFPCFFSCVDKPSNCQRQICNGAASYSCWDGPCALSPTECTEFPRCPALYHRCPDGTCAPITCSLGNPNITCSGTKKLCADGTCADICFLSSGCLPNQQNIQCPNGACVSNMSDCQCNDKGTYLCHDGSCSLTCANPPYWVMLPPGQFYNLAAPYNMTIRDKNNVTVALLVCSTGIIYRLSISSIPESQFSQYIHSSWTADYYKYILSPVLRLSFDNLGTASDLFIYFKVNQQSYNLSESCLATVVSNQWTCINPALPYAIKKRQSSTGFYGASLNSNDAIVALISIPSVIIPPTNITPFPAPTNPVTEAPVTNQTGVSPKPNKNAIVIGSTTGAVVLFAIVLSIVIYFARKYSIRKKSAKQQKAISSDIKLVQQDRLQESLRKIQLSSSSLDHKATVDSTDQDKVPTISVVETTSGIETHEDNLGSSKKNFFIPV
eukprot:TRINITY_DN10349_c1_g1_i2.p1 TRINITY_DN10349_c1_g1~~TRINITY_DN10349_c1_g1_i2.p1  ORF type:complete len:826 (-),score=98.45 TRINITY_DN10349_c1_g1_i2:46-2523(-)